MDRRSFITSIAVVGFGNLFLPRALDRFRWRTPPLSYSIINPDYVNAPYELECFDMDGTIRCAKSLIWEPYPFRFAFPVDLTNREEVERHSIPPFIRVPRV